MAALRAGSVSARQGGAPHRPSSLRRHAFVLGCCIWAMSAAGFACAADPGVDASPAAPAPSATSLCLPDLDGALSAAEGRAQVGATARVLVQAAPFAMLPDLEGAVDAAGRRIVDWRLQRDGVEQAMAVEDGGSGWWAAEWPDLRADLAIPLDRDQALLGLYRQDDDGLWLLAIASAAPNPPRGRTLIRYEAPLPVLRTPLRAGDAWTATIATSGTLDGLPWQGVDAWQVRATAGGRIELPDFSAGPTLRVRSEVEVRSVLGPTVRRTQISWMFECMGELGRATLDGSGALIERRLLRP